MFNSSCSLFMWVCLFCDCADNTSVNCPAHDLSAIQRWRRHHSMERAWRREATQPHNRVLLSETATHVSKSRHLDVVPLKMDFPRAFWGFGAGVSQTCPYFPTKT
eukprot:3318099-Amphidinium_carterae.1